MAGNTNSASDQGFASMDEDERRNMASDGGQVSSGKFGDSNGADPSEAGQQGAQAQSVEAKRRGGENSHQNDEDDDEDESEE